MLARRPVYAGVGPTHPALCLPALQICKDPVKVKAEFCRVLVTLLPRNASFERTPNVGIVVVANVHVFLSVRNQALTSVHPASPLTICCNKWASSTVLL